MKFHFPIWIPYKHPFVKGFVITQTEGWHCNLSNRKLRRALFKNLNIDLKLNFRPQIVWKTQRRRRRENQKKKKNVKMSPTWLQSIIVEPFGRFLSVRKNNFHKRWAHKREKESAESVTNQWFLHTIIAIIIKICHLLSLKEKVQIMLLVSSLTAVLPI